MEGNFLHAFTFVSLNSWIKWKYLYLLFYKYYSAQFYNVPGTVSRKITALYKKTKTEWKNIYEYAHLTFNVCTYVMAVCASVAVIKEMNAIHSTYIIKKYFFFLIKTQP